MKKLIKRYMIAALLGCAMILCMAACSKKEPQVVVTAPETQPRYLTACVLYSGKVEGNDYNVLCQDGATRAQNSLGVTVTGIESTDTSMEKDLETAAAGNYDLIVCTSEDFEDALKKIAGDHKDKSFAIIGKDVLEDNIMSFTIAPDQENTDAADATYEAVRSIVNLTYKGGTSTILGAE